MSKKFNIDFDTQIYESYLNNSIDDTIVSSLVQVYFLISFYEKYGLPFMNEDKQIVTYKNGQLLANNVSPIINEQGDSLYFSKSFLNIVKRKENIANKLEELKERQIYNEIKNLKKHMLFSDEHEIAIADQIYPEIVDNLKAKNKFSQGEAIFLLTLLVFRKETCESYLSRTIDEDSKRELLQTYIVGVYLDSIKEEARKKYIHPSVVDIINYMEEIRHYLCDKVTEDEILHNYKLVIDAVPDLAHIKDKVLDFVSVSLDAAPSKNSSYNDCVKIRYEENTFKIDFIESNCKKLLAKKLNRDSLRELCQAYFLYIYYENFGLSFKAKDENIYDMSRNISSIEGYIEEIYKKINGKINDEVFDFSTNIIMDVLSKNEEDIRKINSKVIYPIKKLFELTTPSLFKHKL